MSTEKKETEETKVTVPEPAFFQRYIKELKEFQKTTNIKNQVFKNVLNELNNDQSVLREISEKTLKELFTKYLFSIANLRTIYFFQIFANRLQLKIKLYKDENITTVFADALNHIYNGHININITQGNEEEIYYSLLNNIQLLQDEIVGLKQYVNADITYTKYFTKQINIGLFKHEKTQNNQKHILKMFSEQFPEIKPFNLKYINNFNEDDRIHLAARDFILLYQIFQLIIMSFNHEFQSGIFLQKLTFDEMCNSTKMKESIIKIIEQLKNLNPKLKSKIKKLDV